jgi:hypothetical protein
LFFCGLLDKHYKKIGAKLPIFLELSISLQTKLAITMKKTIILHAGQGDADSP